MVGSRLSAELDRVVCQVKGLGPAEPFDGLHIVAVGDFLPFPPALEAYFWGSSRTEFYLD